jgi:hypothetical protein
LQKCCICGVTRLCSSLQRSWWIPYTSDLKCCLVWSLLRSLCKTSKLIPVQQ